MCFLLPARWNCLLTTLKSETNCILRPLQKHVDVSHKSWFVVISLSTGSGTTVLWLSSRKLDKLWQPWGLRGGLEIQNTHMHIRSQSYKQSHQVAHTGNITSAATERRGSCRWDCGMLCCFCVCWQHHWGLSPIRVQLWADPSLQHNMTSLSMSCWREQELRSSPRGVGGSEEVWGGNTGRVMDYIRVITRPLLANLKRTFLGFRGILALTPPRGKPPNAQAWMLLVGGSHSLFNQSGSRDLFFFRRRLLKQLLHYDQNWINIGF